MFKRVLNWVASNALWTAITSGTVISGVLSVWAWAKDAPGYVVMLVAVFGFVVFAFVPRAVREVLRLTGTRPSALPHGPLTWKLIRQVVQIPDARLSKTSAAWADGVARWDSFAVHNLWANQPITKADFEVWRADVHKWGAEVKVWMETAGCEFLDVKEFAELGYVDGPKLHDDPGLNHELVMLKMKRDRLKVLIERFRVMPNPVIITPEIKVEVGEGTARPGDGQMLPTADIRLGNSGDPFRMIAVAKLLRVTDGFPGGDEWVYEPRLISGGNHTSGFHVATIELPVEANHEMNWVVILRGEHFMVVRRWQGRGHLEFDIEWLFQIQIDAINKPLAIVVTRCTLSDDWKRLETVKLSEDIMPSVFRNEASRSARGV